MPAQSIGAQGISNDMEGMDSSWQGYSLRALTVLAGPSEGEDLLSMRRAPGSRSTKICSMGKAHPNSLYFARNRFFRALFP